MKLIGFHSNRPLARNVDFMSPVYVAPSSACAYLVPVSAFFHAWMDEDEQS